MYSAGQKAWSKVAGKPRLTQPFWPAEYSILFMISRHSASSILYRIFKKTHTFLTLEVQDEHPHVPPLRGLSLLFDHLSGTLDGVEYVTAHQQVQHAEQ